MARAVSVLTGPIVRTWRRGRDEVDPRDCDYAGLLYGGLMLAIGIFATGTMIAAALLTFSGLPAFDEWAIWRQQIAQSDTWWSWLTQPHNSHQIPVPRLLYLALERWGAGSARVMLILTVMSQLGVATVLALLARARGTQLATTGLVFAFAFSGTQWFNFTAGFQVCFVLVYFMVVASLFALSCGRVSVAIVLAALATGTEANGLLVWPLLTALSACLGMRRRVTVGLSLATVVVITVFLSQHHADPPVTLYDLSSQGVTLPVFLFAYLGSALEEPLMALTTAVGLSWGTYRLALCALAGAVGVGWFVRVLGTMIRAPETITRARLTLMASATFMVGSGVLTAFGRAHLGVSAALTSRYTTPCLLFWVCLIVLTLGANWTRERARIAVLAAAVFVGVVLQLPKAAYAVDYTWYMREGEYTIINGVEDPRLWSRFFPDTNYMVPVVEHFRRHRLGSFAQPWTAWIGHPLAAHYRIAATPTRCAGQWETANDFGVNRQATEATGWAYDRVTRSAPELLIFADDRGHILGFTRPTRRKPAVRKAHHPEAGTDRLGWVSYFLPAHDGRATVYAVSADGATLCPVGAWPRR